MSKTPTSATTAPVVLRASKSSSFDVPGSSSFRESDSETVTQNEIKVTGGSDLTLVTPLTATSSVTSTYRNWVGPRPLSPDQACYREAHIMDTCPTNFDRNEATNTCWAECPIDYPIECGMECLRQNDDCTKQIFNKIGVVINVGLNGIMYNVFGKWADMAKSFKTAVMCTTMVLGMTRALIRYTRNIKTSNPTASQDKILAILFQSNNIVIDLPITIKLCLGKRLRKTVATIVNDLITNGKSDNGSHAEAKDFTYKFIDKGLLAFAALGFEMTGIPGMFAEYLQTICGPTQYIGEIDDGTHPDTLGLTIKQNAFNGSSLSWTRQGDGEVIINFTSNDTEDVSVNIMSGGDKVDEVEVKAGSNATWRSNVTALGGKTLYLDRWRPGFLGLPGTGGGSMLLWVPHASEGGHLELGARLNVS
ncbi:hypothetical protein BBJ29_008321 [Phytophthora kernoviae]|uniref:Jacalin-type lectin domain-containing protein n=1 Tax=Phytophthora kernoviae TaxID=325452 RepID=A0A3F2RCG3_9STRA|nr:hypothetical protein BBP00_00009496 [Phytophthora kernoviae]RLN71374.1 hypothetical protein BBJ29_008321 [Phytophthora kernoviae]